MQALQEHGLYLTVLHMNLFLDFPGFTSSVQCGCVYMHINADIQVYLRTVDMNTLQKLHVVFRVLVQFCFMLCPQLSTNTIGLSQSTPPLHPTPVPQT